MTDRIWHTRIPAPVRPVQAAGAMAAALILSSCSAIGPADDLAVAGSPKPLPGHPGVAAAEPTVSGPLQLVPSMAFDWVHAAAAPSVASIDGDDAVGSVWAGMTLITEPLALAAHDPVAPAEALPLLVADGAYYEPVAAGETPCLRDTGPNVQHVSCSSWDDQIAMAPQTVDDSLLADQRGGFITVGGFQIDIGIQVETLINGVTTLTTALTLDDVVNGGLEGIQIGQISIGNGDAATDVTHNVDLGGVNTVINNSQDDLDITTLATMAIDVINLQQPQTGNSFGASPRMAPELQQSIIRGISQ